MQVNISLTRNGWYEYKEKGSSIYVRGYAHIADVYYDTQTLAKHLLGKTEEELKAIVSTLNGTWAMVVFDANQSFTFLAVDHLRSIQLFYRVDDGALFIFDDVTAFRKEKALTFDEDCVHEYLSSGYVYQHRTLFKNVFSLQAAEWRLFDQYLNSSSGRYWRYIPNIKKPLVADASLIQRIDDAFIAAMKRLQESVGNRRIVVPLSGGYDSRLIVNYLYKAGIKHVLCYTYGREGNGEAVCSKEVAVRLGYEWHFVETTPETEHALQFDATMRDYYLYMANGTNRPCFQEYTALKTLKEKGILSSSDIIVPGYYFDYLAGSHVERRIYRWNVCSETYIWENNFFPRGAIKRTMRAIARGFDAQHDLTRYQFCEGWSWQERLAKFIVNNVRCFEYLGFEWRLPVCDFELFKLWLSIPYELRHERNYFKTIFPLLVVDELKDAPFHITKGNTKTALGALIGKYTPAFWRFLLRDFRSCNKKVDLNNPSIELMNKIATYFSGSIASRLQANLHPVAGNKLMTIMALHYTISK